MIVAAPAAIAGGSVHPCSGRLMQSDETIRKALIVTAAVAGGLLWLVIVVYALGVRAGRFNFG